LGGTGGVPAAGFGGTGGFAAGGGAPSEGAAGLWLSLPGAGGAAAGFGGTVGFTGSDGAGFSGFGLGFWFSSATVYFISILKQEGKLFAKSGIARTHKTRNLNTRFVVVSTRTRIIARSL
jgi:hypothetical protein